MPEDGRFNRYYTVDTAARLLEGFVQQAQKAYQTLGLFEPEHCVGDRCQQDYTGKVLVLSPDMLRESCWTPRDQLWAAEGGFGCSPTASGRAVYAICSITDQVATGRFLELLQGVGKDEIHPLEAVPRQHGLDAAFCQSTAHLIRMVPDGLLYGSCADDIFPEAGIILLFHAVSHGLPIGIPV